MFRPTFQFRLVTDGFLLILNSLPAIFGIFWGEKFLVGFYAKSVSWLVCPSVVLLEDFIIYLGGFYINAQA